MFSSVPTGPPTCSIYPVTTARSDHLSFLPFFRKTTSLSRHSGPTTDPRPLALSRLLLLPTKNTSLPRPTTHRSPTTTPPISKTSPKPSKDLHYIQLSRPLLGQTKSPLTPTRSSPTLHRASPPEPLPPPLRTAVIFFSFSLSVRPLVVFHFKYINNVGHCHPLCDLASLIEEDDISNPDFFRHTDIYCTPDDRDPRRLRYTYKPNRRLPYHVRL